MICPPHDLRLRRVMSIVASASSDANIKTIVSSSHQAKLNSFQRSAFLHGPPPSCSGAVSFYIYISTYLQVGLHVGHRPTQCFSPSMLCVKSFYCHYLIFQFYGKSKCNKPLTHIQYSYYQYYYNNYYYHLPLAMFFMFLSFRGMF